MSKVNSVDHDEMPHYAAFHQGLHRLPKYLLRSRQYTKSNRLFIKQNNGNVSLFFSLKIVAMVLNAVVWNIANLDTCPLTSSQVL